MSNYSNYTNEQLEQYLVVWNNNVDQSKGAMSREFALMQRDAIREEIKRRAQESSNIVAR